MRCVMTEKTYIDDMYCFSITEVGDVFFIAVCTAEEYDTKPQELREYYFVGMRSALDGWSWEKIEELLEDKTFLLESAMLCMKHMAESKEIIRESGFEREERLVGEMKKELYETIEVASHTCWTLEQASRYSHIGINQLRKESLRKDCPWLLWVGKTKRLVKVEAFKEWLAEQRYVD